MRRKVLVGTEGKTALGAFLDNAGHGAVRGLVFVANTLILVPLLMASLGKDRFAILTLVTPFFRYGFNGVFDPGVTAGMTRYTSRSFATSDTQAINSYISSGMAVYLVFGTTLVGLYYVLWPILMPHLIRTNVQFYGDARMMFNQAVWIYFLFSLSNPFCALLMGIQRVEATHWIGTLTLLIELGGILLLAPARLTLAGVMWVYSVNAFVCLIFSVFLAWHFFRL